MHASFPASSLGPCSCSQIRRTSRRISSLYDEVLASSGLTITQYAVLAKIARAQPVGRTALAVILGMDRTTLLRNLRPLQAANLIAGAKSSDRRENLLRLSASGQRKLERTRPLWEEAQSRFASAFGTEPLKQLRQLLTRAEEVAAQSLKSPR
jgi:DNA-binding MarR family transcriptional regulator